MPTKHNFQSSHFTLERLKNGLLAAIHKSGGAAYTNAGIVDLGDRTLVVDAFDTMMAGRDLRRAAETLFSRPVETILLTHAHSDHWIGASAFDPTTSLLASKVTYQESLEWGKEMVEGFQEPEEWQVWLNENLEKLKTEQDDGVRASLEKSITRIRYTMAEMADFTPRYADRTFEDSFSFQGSERYAEFRSLGPGHSGDDAVLLLPEDGVMFIGDIIFANEQPFMGFCDLARWREQLDFLLVSDYQAFVPGHGSICGKKEIKLQSNYFDVMENLIQEVVQRGDPFEKALKIELPPPFDDWLFGFRGRFESNVRMLFELLGGELPKTE